MSDKIIFVDGSKFERPIPPMPPPELGRELHTVEDVRLWLEHPSNQFHSVLFKLKFDGVVPKMSFETADRFRYFPEEAEGFYRVVITEQARLKALGRKRDKEDAEDTAGELDT